MINDEQYSQLLKPLNPSRVAKRTGGGNKSLSYLEAWDVKAHLIRIFGFLNWSADVIESALAFEEQKDEKWSVGYKVVLRLTIFSDPEGYNRVTYTEAAVGSAILGQRGEAHDMAIKTAESDALKRAAINLGTQFGLSLYDNGSTKDVVGKTLDRDTVSQEGEPELPVTEISETVPDSDGAAEWIASMKEAIDAKDVPALLNMKKAMQTEKVAEYTYQGVTLAKWLDKAIAAVGKEK